MASELDDIQQALESYQEALTDIARSIAISGGSIVAQKATEEYMRDAGAAGPPFQPRESAGGPLRILSGRLARSLTGAGGRTGGRQGISPQMDLRSVGTITPGGLGTRNFPTPGRAGGLFRDESINRVTITGNGVTLEKGSKVPYAPVHEYGFAGQVHVRQHTRTTRFGTHTVPAHTRMMNIPARPFLEPALEDSREQIAGMAEDQLGDTAEVVLSA